MIKYIGALKQWWTTWGTLPIGSWVKGAYYYKAGNFAAASKFYEKGLLKYPGHPASNCARIDLAYCLFRQQKFEAAERFLRVVISQLPRSREAYDRLAKLHMWTGNYLEAAWTYRRALQHIPGDADFVAGFLQAVLENGGPGYLILEAQRELLSLTQADLKKPRVVVARALLAMHNDDAAQSEKLLEELVHQASAPLEAFLYYGRLLDRSGKVANSRRFLRIAMTASPNSPRVLTLFAQTYLKPGAFYNPSFARQLATTAAQNTGWLSPWAMHTLAEAYYHEGDKMAALIMASKAKDVGNQRLGAYKEEKVLNQLIESLSESTLA
jgi:Tfp pilus assembly protein PilF